MHARARAKMQSSARARACSRAREREALGRVRAGTGMAGGCGGGAEVAGVEFCNGMEVVGGKGADVVVEVKRLLRFPHILWSVA